MTTLSNLCVLFFAIGKVALLCGFLPGIAIAVALRIFGCPVVRHLSSLAECCGFEPQRQNIAGNSR